MKDIGVEFRDDMTMEEKRRKMLLCIADYLPFHLLDWQVQSEHGEWGTYRGSDPLALLFAKRALITGIQITTP